MKIYPLKRLVYLCLLTFICSFTSTAQELGHQAPTLQIGLDGLSFGKGSLDAQLITEIISAKQNEIKIKLVQNTFLSKLNHSGGTVYNYANNIIKGVVEESNTKIRTRKILENTVNLVFVYSFADFYLKHLDSNERRGLDTLARLMLDSTSGKSMKYKEGLNAGHLFKGWEGHKRDLHNHSNNHSQNIPAVKMNEFVALILDLSSEAVRNNEKLQELGLMRISFSNTYEYMNKYKILLREAKQIRKFESEKAVTDKKEIKGELNENNYEDFKRILNDLLGISNRNKEDEKKIKMEEAAKVVYTDLSKKLKQYTNLIGALNYTLNTTGYKSLFQDISTLDTISTNEVFSFDKMLSAIDSSIYSISKNYHNLVSGKHTSVEFLTYHNHLTTSLRDLQKVKEYILRVKKVTSNKHKGIGVYSDLVYSFQEEIKPILTQNVLYNPKLSESISEVNKLLDMLHRSLTKKVEIQGLSGDPAHFIRLTSALYDFDKTKTFSEYRNLLVLLDGIFEDNKINESFATINTFVKDYVIIQQSEKGEVLYFNVESFLTKLSAIKSPKIRRLQVHFTVGANTMNFYKNPVQIDDSISITTLATIGEKVGVKYKIISKGDLWPRNIGESYELNGKTYIKSTPPKEPLISNWHVILYGSGILYNVINSTTNEAFDMPTLSVGTGLTFYNSLDFNASLGIPLLDDVGLDAYKLYPFVNLGFDIRFTEYMQALNKKRKDAKIQKQIVTARSVQNNFVQD